MKGEIYALIKSGHLKEFGVGVKPVSSPPTSPLHLEKINTTTMTDNQEGKMTINLGHPKGKG